jgi:hypothetical protein
VGFLGFVEEGKRRVEEGSTARLPGHGVFEKNSYAYEKCSRRTRIPNEWAEHQPAARPAVASLASAPGQKGQGWVQ